MKITIDTRQDSNEDIKKAIHMLSSLVGVDIKEERKADVFDSDENPKEGMFNMFGNSDPSDGTMSSEPEEVQIEKDSSKVQIVEY